MKRNIHELPQKLMNSTPYPYILLNREHQWGDLMKMQKEQIRMPTSLVEDLKAIKQGTK